MNRIVAIGFTGSKIVYLNITRREALERYVKEHGEKYTDSHGEICYWADTEDESPYVDEFEFEDEFQAYAVWPNGGW